MSFLPNGSALVSVVVVLLWSVWPSSAALLVSDSFDYPDGSLVGALGSSWLHHSGGTSTTGEVKVVSTRAFLAQTNSEDVSVLLPGQPLFATNSPVLYASFMASFSVLPTGAGTYFAHFRDASTGYRGKLFVTTNGAAAGAYRVGVANAANAPSATLPLDLSLNTEYRFLLRYSLTNTVATLWVNPAWESEPSVTASDSAGAIGVVAFALREQGGTDGSGHAFVDNVLIGTAFSDVTSGAAPQNAPSVSITPPSQVVTEGADTVFSASVLGESPFFYQWRLYGTNLAGATASTISLSGVTSDQSGPYSVLVTNVWGSALGGPAELKVNPAAHSGLPALRVVHYNAHGNGLTDWSTNVAQVRALGRQLKYLDPDVVTLNEVPYSCTWQVPDFVNAYLPGYSMATNSGTDGYIRSVVLSRFPIRFSQKWLDGSSLAAFGYNGNFTRDLFQAQVAVPGFARPLDVFVTHLKAMSTQDSANKRAAEAGAISNFFAVTYLRGTNALNAYFLAGDLNEDIFRPETNRYMTGQPIQRLANTATGLELTTPLNRVTSDDRTLSIQTTLDVRFDYILPGALLFSNVVTSEVFRTDVLTNTPPGLLADDDKTASDHLPVLMVFGNPYDQPFRLVSVTRRNQNAALAWQSVRGQQYQVEHTVNFLTWSVLASNVVATNTTCELETPVFQKAEFFRVYRVP